MMTARDMGMDLSGKTKLMLSAALILHDVGKIGIPDNILCKPGQLTQDEWQVMKTHVEKGARILEPLTDFKKVRDIIMAHHERFDGKGYPEGLKGDQIPLIASIITVADSFDAMSTDRPYRAALNKTNAINEIRHLSGRQFSPAVTDTFLELCQEGKI